MNNIDTMSVNAIRVLSADAIQKAKSGHPGLPLGCASVAYELWAKHLKHNPKDPDWKDRDRFILSGGHGSMLLYSLLHLFGYGDLKKEDLMQLYGFLTRDELRVFRLLIGVNGIGPKVGLSVLSTLSVYELKMAVISEDVKTISKTPGLGPKGAKKLILELKDKLSFEELEEDGVGAEIFDTSADSSDSVMITIEGLVSLGYSKSEAAIAVNKVEDAKDLTPEELLKKALKNIMI